MKPNGRIRGRLIAVDGVNGAAIKATAKALIKELPRAERGGVSVWDASGVFGDLIAADPQAGRPSPRTLLLLYAADLAFRLRWEIRPTIAEGRTVVAAPYVATAIAFGRAAGLPAGWLKDLFSFALKPDATRFVDETPVGRRKAASFVDFACERVVANGLLLSRGELGARARTHLKVSARF